MIIVPVRSRPDGLCVQLPTMMQNYGVYPDLHLTLRLLGFFVIVRVEHRDHRNGAARIPPGPITLDKGALHRFPMLVLSSSLRLIAVAGMVVNGVEKLNELLQIHTHLEHELA